MADKIEASKYAIRDAVIFAIVAFLPSSVYCFFISAEPCSFESYISMTGAFLVLFITYFKQKGVSPDPSDKTSKLALLDNILCKLHFHF